jgi:SAM-dependent methyltransferase
VALLTTRASEPPPASAPPAPDARAGKASLIEINSRFYDPLWAHSRLVSPERFNTWPLVQSLVGSSRSRLEVAPGLCPRLPLEGTRFLDLSAAAVEKLVAAGADARAGVVSRLPWPDAAFDLVAAFDILEHVDDDEEALAELSRVAAPGGTLLVSAPIHPGRWTPFDDLVGHARRYEPAALLDMLARAGWCVEQSAVYGMQPESPRLLDFVVWSFQHRRERAIWWYSRVILPLGARFQKPLKLVPGLIDLADVDEVLLVCRRTVTK